MPIIRALLIALVTLVLMRIPARAQTYTQLHSFQGGSDGGYAKIIAKGANGYFYGITSSGGDASCNPPLGCGTIFRLKGTREGVLANLPVLFEADIRSLIFHNGTLYGTTDGGGGSGCGGYGCGTVFKSDLAGNLTLLYAFTGGALGDGPQGPLVEDATESLYGPTVDGGDLNCGGSGYGCGTIFKLDSAGGLKTLHSFSGGTEGRWPGGLTAGEGGTFYGATSGGGDVSCPPGGGYGCGIVYKLSKKGNLTVLHTFHGGSDGAQSEQARPPVRDAVGNLYGTTPLGGGEACGGYGCGTVFKIDATGNYSVFYRFTGAKDGGYGLYNSKVLAVDPKTGNVYGITTSGGDPTCDCGTAFKLDPSGSLTTLHTFLGGTDGGDPYWVVWDGAGHLYGTASTGGAYGYGLVFKITP
jgi:uncharacterized repeat protein (TIGR03803 family)